MELSLKSFIPRHHVRMSLARVVDGAPIGKTIAAGAEPRRRIAVHTEPHIAVSTEPRIAGST